MFRANDSEGEEEPRVGSDSDGRKRSENKKERRGEKCLRC